MHLIKLLTEPDSDYYFECRRKWRSLKRRTMTNLTAIRSAGHARAIRARDSFLSRHPELRRLQDEIDKKLRGAESSHNRLVIIHSLMMESFFRLQGKLQAITRKKR
jgi:hypothetical protein